MSLQLSVGFANYGSTFGAGEWTGLLDLARAADDAGIDRIIVVDHVVMGEHTENYQWGKFPVPPDAPWLEPLAVLSAMAAVTTHTRLATGILIAPLRPPALLAKQVATLDQLSNGRVDLGVGTGWQREEYDAEGIDFDQRGQLLTDGIAALKALWRDTPASFVSPTLSFHDIYCEPKPVQPDGVPLWIAGTLHGRNLARLVDHGDAWIPIMGETIEGIADGVARIKDAWAAAGRDPSTLQVRGPAPIVPGDIARTLESVGELQNAGVTDVHVPLRAFARDATDAPKALDELATRFRSVAQ
jgi:probable F420-dependent oxidoreductase